MIYKPFSPPSDAKDLPAYLTKELQRIADAMGGADSSLSLVTLHAAPRKLTDGLVCLADGTNWNPGSGAGVYVYRGAAWHYLG